MSAANYPAYNAMSNYRSATPPQTTFTFTTPTQCSTLGTPRPCIQTMSPMRLNAPGVGASWQHSIPTTMPWVDLSMMQHGTPVGAATVFTGVPFNMINGAHPLAGEIPRRPKKRSVENSSEGPMCKIHRCADQLANMRISPQHDQTRERSNNLSGRSSLSGRSRARSEGRSKGHVSQTEQWQKFQELENRLSSDDEGASMSPERDSSSPDNIRVSVAEGVIQDLSKGSPNPILPRTVMEGITKPCMQVVLWQSPESLLRPAECINSSPPHSSRHSQAASTTSHTSTPPSDISAQSQHSPHARSWSHSHQPGNASTSCSLSASPGFLQPLSSSTGSPSNLASRVDTATNRSDAFHHRLGGAYNNNNNDLVFNNNNDLVFNNNNMMEMFDSVDDEMQL